MGRCLRLEDFPDGPEPEPGTIAWRCRQARQVRPNLAPGTVGRIACLSAGHYHRIERGTKIPTIDVVRKIVLAFGSLGVDVTEEYLAFAKGRAPRKVRAKPVAAVASPEARPGVAGPTAPETA